MRFVIASPRSARPYLSLLGLMLGVASCTYDFEEPFKNSGSESTSSSGNNSGAGASGGQGGTGGAIPGTGAGLATGGAGGTGATGGAGGEDLPPESETALDCASGALSCNDPKCTGLGFEQAPAAPANSPSGKWLGPAWFYYGSQAGVLDCQTAVLHYEEELNGGFEIEGGDFTCSECECGAHVPGSEECYVTSATIKQFGSTNCAANSVFNTAVSLTNQAPGDCKLWTPNASSSLDGFQAENVNGIETSNPGTCEATGGVITPNLSKPAKWKNLGRICLWDEDKTVTANPPSGTLCRVKPPSAFQPTQCIVAETEGDRNCPAGPVGVAYYDQKFLLYSDMNDNRECSACDCGLDNYSCKVDSVGVYKDSNCQDGLSLDTGICTKTTAHGKFYTYAKYELDSLQGGKCVNPSGGNPNNQALWFQPTKVKTVCCIDDENLQHQGPPK